MLLFNITKSHEGVNAPGAKCFCQVCGLYLSELPLHTLDLKEQPNEKQGLFCLEEF